ncbi:serine protease snake-like isoform X2 [Teleopsis dalmanni]|uniref:serine protease snake-like isoform X2 n=1 Tax=Teleopsis dalmanni TaxID=139649 RepID=UPI0018CF1DFC|nr:serine protease snake-like isoform X2 [Teleopsis dalmanni]
MRSIDPLYFSLVFVIRGVFASKIIFPTVDDFPLDCKIDNNTWGLCVNIKSCATALTVPNSEVKTCYFLQSEQFVCCKDFGGDELKTERKYRALKECEDFYPDADYVLRGTQTKPKEFPYMVALGWKSNEGNSTDYRCGGVLISSEFVLTAAHCTEFNGRPPSVVVLGGVNLSEDDYTKYNITKVILHPLYDPEFSYNDIALLKIKKEKHDIHPIACLWTSSDINVDTVTVIGYGNTRFVGSQSPHLLKADLDIIPNKDCQSFYIDEDNLPKGILDQQICAKDPENKQDACQGDSGGPLITKVRRMVVVRPFTFGITSVGQGCGGQTPGVYMRVSEFVDWIAAIVWSNLDNVNMIITEYSQI